MNQDLSIENNRTFKNTGVEVIKKVWENAPITPGVYRMFDKNGRLLYVGKAKNLRNRIKNYTDLKGLSRRIQDMVLSTASMEIVEVKTEYQALLLESDLIKSLKPKYNILLKDDKSYPYIVITKEDIPRLQKFRISGMEKKKTDDKYYFGPYASIGDINEAVKLLQKAFGIRICSDISLKNRVRPCILHQIKRCMAPCMIGKNFFASDELSRDDYISSVKNAVSFLLGKSSDLIDELKKEMQDFSSKMMYERAKDIRDKIELISSLQQQKSLYNLTDDNVDIIAVYKDDTLSIKNSAFFSIHIVFIRNSMISGSFDFFPSNTDNASEFDVLMAFINQFYSEQNSSALPKEIWISSDFDNSDENNLNIKSETEQLLGFKIIAPKIGDKKLIVDDAVALAKQALIKHRNSLMKDEQFLIEIAKIFDISKPINHIEVFDNSHLFGKQKVGAMIVFKKDSGFTKKLYRKYNIQSDIAGDDYAMMREVLERRYTRAVEENNFPDLILIDGGRGQLFIANEVLLKLGVEIPIIGVAKGEHRNKPEETLFMRGKEPVKLDADSPLLFFIERLRDEAHRFVITTHRKKRASETFTSELDEIEGIGAKKKKALLLHFGSVKNIINKTESEIAKVDGIDKNLAKRIYDHFH